MTSEAESTASVEATRRLDRLEGYLRSDPANESLLADAFVAALAASAWDRAEFHLRHAQALHLQPLVWSLHEAHWLLAQRRWSQARVALLGLGAQLLPGSAEEATVAHDLAYIDWQSGDVLAAIARLAPLLEGGDKPMAQPPALQALWVRLLHRAGELERALQWLARSEADGQLDPLAAGVGSLAALDDADFKASLRWAEAALQAGAVTSEALVARASLAIAEQDVERARALLERALVGNPDDGRIWSAIGFAELLGQRLDAARAAFARAVATMPEHVGTWHGLGWTAIAQQQLEAARAAFARAVELDRNFAESHGGLAVVEALAGETSQARASIGRALGLDRASLSARYAEALLAGDARNVEAVLRLGERLL
ncbi:MAG: hypothetical protein M3Z16_02510, partial [Pseudomonadota bacterium]|nr:hypothetical protein [Pseudomonadota bacterium]